MAKRYYYCVRIFCLAVYIDWSFTELFPLLCCRAIGFLLLLLSINIAHSRTVIPRDVDLQIADSVGGLSELQSSEYKTVSG